MTRCHRDLLQLGENYVEAATFWPRPGLLLTENDKKGDIYMSGFYDVIPVVVIFGVFAFMLQAFLDYRVRIKLIDKGLVDEKVKHLYADRAPQSLPTSLKWGMVLVGIGLAIILGRLMPYEIADEITVSGMFVFGGLGLLIYAVLEMNARRKQRLNSRPETLANPIE
jgi:hypothetical protein